MLDTDTALFAAGNLIQLLNLRTKEHKYLRSTSGGGIGAIAVSTSTQLITQLRNYRHSVPQWSRVCTFPYKIRTFFPYKLAQG